ncbi:S8 family serine peptidase [Sinosporangium siamense]|uniref:Serine protease n=1 Tax=Sinosporangium siamense TaxID=1367973 RepID=A0A919V3Z7_9ACTN|nr:S8 family serine peptidase [Sinosporangium siamense]GII90018.1 serine protease [Sinosporangium siamense]
MKLKAGFTALAVAVGAVVSSAAAHAEPAPATPSAAPVPTSAGPVSGTVTLITGDKVTLLRDKNGKPSVRLAPADGREVHFSTRWVGGHLVVIPSDAAPLIARGLLDRRLFDVTELLSFGYGDDKRADIPVIAESRQGSTASLKNAQETKALPGLGFTSSRVPKDKAGDLWRTLQSGAQARTLSGGVEKLWLDGQRQFTLDQSVEQIGAKAAWAQGFTGKGVTLAVLDSGYDAQHPDLQGGVVAHARNFSPEPDIRDEIGHGTHVASTVAGSGAASSGKYRGVAPEAKLAIGKIGGVTGIYDSAILAGMDWAANEIKATAVNMSFGSSDGPEIDPVEQAVNTLSATTNTVFVVAAGNSGPRSIGSPGSADAALTVGAVDKNNVLADFSSTGPRNHDGAVKPDVTAPGVGIVAAAAQGTAAEPYVPMSGTSMATPHVVGAAGILAQRNPTWTGKQIRAALIGSSAKQGTDGPFKQGAGRVDVVRAIAQTVTAEPASLSVEFPWPHTGDQQVTKTVTYVNHGAAPVTLDLALENGDTPLPNGLITLSAQQVQVPAGGQAAVTLNLADRDIPVAPYSAVLTATSGETVVRTPLGAHVAPETYDVSVEIIGRDGAAPSMVIGGAYRLEPVEYFELPPSGKLRLPVGEWFVQADVFSADNSFTTVYAAVTVKAGVQPVVLDARKAKQIKFSVDRPDAAPVPGMNHLYLHKQGASSVEFGASLGGRDIQEKSYVLPVRQRGLSYGVSTSFAQQGAAQSPYLYDLTQYESGGLPDNPVLHAKTKDLAKVVVDYRANGADGQADVFVGSSIGETAMYGPPALVKLPSKVTHYRTPHRALTWHSGFGQDQFELYEVDRGRPLARKSYSETWNAAVRAPSAEDYSGIRSGDEIFVSAYPSFSGPVAGRVGTDAGAKGTVTLAKDGQVLAKQDYTGCYGPSQCALTTQVPSAAGVYTATATATRDVPRATLSPSVETTWTFPSAKTTEGKPLPLLHVRYAPKGLDAYNRAKTGKATLIPLRVETAAGVPAPRVRSVSVEASGDDGATWTRVRVTRTAKGWAAVVPANLTGSFVSLRTAVDAGADTKVTQTVKRAYALIP